MTTEDKLLATSLERLASSYEVTQPPVPHLLMRGRRARNRRRLSGLATAAIAVAGTLAAAAIAATSTDAPTSAPIATQEESSATEPADQDKFQLSEATVARLRDLVDQSLKSAASGVRWTDAYFPESPTGKGQPPEVITTPDGGTSRQQMYSISGSIVHGERRGQFEIQVEGVEYCDPGNQGKENCDSPKNIQETQKRRKAMLSCQEKLEFRTRCAETAGPRGERILTMSFASSAGNGSLGRRWDWVYVLLSDGSVLLASNSNYYPDPVKKSVRAQPEPPLAEQQLVTIATNVASHLKP